MFTKTKNILFSFLALCLINPVLCIDPPETPIQNASTEPKTLNDALGKMKELKERAENIKDEKEKEQTKLINIENILKFLEENKKESLDDYVMIIKTMIMIVERIKNTSFSGEAKEVTDNLSNLIDRIVNIEKEEARKKISLEEWKKLTVKKLSTYFIYLEDDSTKDIFMKAIESNSLDYSECLSFEDFKNMIHSLCIAMSENEGNISKSITFIGNLIRKSKISDKKTLFPHYIRYPEMYDAFIQGISVNQFLSYFSKNKNAVDFLQKIIKNKDDFTQNLETASVLDSIYRFSTLKPLEMGENTAYYGLKYIAKSCVGMLILPFQLIYEYL